VPAQPLKRIGNPTSLSGPIGPESSLQRLASPRLARPFHHTSNPTRSTHLVCLLFDLNIQLEQCLDMITRKRNRNQQDVLLAQLAQPFDSVGRLRTLPCGWADLRLPGQSVRVGMPEFLHDGKNRGGDFGDVRVTSATRAQS
jgi:hypothetical protein